MTAGGCREGWAAALARGWAKVLARGGAAALALGIASAPLHGAPDVVGATHMRAGVDPGFARLGERVVYRGQVLFAGPANAKWLPPEPEADLTWGAPRAWGSGGPGGETLQVEIPLQAFRPGTIVIPGLRFQERDSAGAAPRRLPVVLFTVRPVLTAADSNADLRPARGPLPAPWYERVPWLAVLLGALAVVVIALLVRAWRSRRRSARAPEPQVLDPAARALAELEALRALSLPEHGRYDEHALRLSWILRRYLEAVIHAPRPGHTTPELVAALAHSPLGPDDVERLESLLRVWDRLKFARAGSSIEACVRSEQAVEALVRKLAAPAAGKAA